MSRLSTVSLPTRWLRALSRLPAAAWVCALVACLNAGAWSIAVPPFLGPDEQAHFAYVQVLAERGVIPKSGIAYSQEEEAVLADLHQNEVILDPTRGLVLSSAEGQQLRQDLDAPLARGNGYAAGVAGTEPPLYYAFEAIPYRLGSGSTLLVRLELMRLLSALMAGVTVLFVFLFLREALPAIPWAWTVGGLCAALAPLLGSVSGTVNPDALLAAVSAAVFYALARAFRRGLTLKLAIAIGALIAAGFVSKLNFIGLAPGAILGLVALAVREARTSGRRLAFRSLALGGGIALSPALFYVAFKSLKHPGTGLVGVAEAFAAKQGGQLAALSYFWQLYLPRLPGMTNDFPGISSTYQIWFKGLIGRYNWLETVFPSWVYGFALIPGGLIVLLFVRELITRRAMLGRRLSELIVYLTMAAGLMALIAVGSYLVFPASDGEETEPRYMLPMLALGCVVPALAARGAGRRWGPVVGAVIVLLFLAHDVFSQLLEISRFYA